MLRLPNRLPLIRAVFAFSGFDAKPNRPITIRKTPYTTTYFQVDAFIGGNKA